MTAFEFALGLVLLLVCILAACGLVYLHDLAADRWGKQ